jgi:signal transduction histidine kinase
VIVLQSQAAQRVASTDLAAARRALEAIETTAREGLAELRRLLDILLVEVDADELEPRPSLAHLQLLVDRGP